MNNFQGYMLDHFIDKRLLMLGVNNGRHVAKVVACNRIRMLHCGINGRMLLQLTIHFPENGFKAPRPHQSIPQ